MMFTNKSYNSSCNTTPLDSLFDFDGLFSSTFDFNSNDEYDQQPVMLKEEDYNDSSSSTEVNISQ